MRLLEAELNIKDIVKSPNIAEDLSDHDLELIGKQVFDEWIIDKTSREPWETKTAMALNLAMQVMDEKTFPWQGASNVKFPLVTIAALQYQARAYPALVPSSDLVKCRIIGSDPQGIKLDRANRVSQHMSYQILEEDEDWEEQMDRVLISQAIVGCAFKKTFFNPLSGHNESEHVHAKDLYIPYFSKSLETAPRITHVLYWSENDLYERFNAGLICDWNKESKPDYTSTSQLEEAKQKSQGIIRPSFDPSQPYEILEQHTFLDLDNDGYKEPYVVYVRTDNRQVLRIVARFSSVNVKRKNDLITRIEADSYFTKFPFIPSPDGGIYDLGFGVLLGPLNESINTLINQLIDAGTLSNTAGGFLGRGVKMRAGDNSFKPFEWKRVDSTGDDLRKGVFPLPVREPSQVLLALLGILIDYGERIGMAVDPLVGKNPGQNTPAETSRNMLSEGQRIFSAVFKRTHRALKDEFRKWYCLNKIYLDDVVEYYPEYADEGKKALRMDYSGEGKDIIPMSDPNMASDQDRIQQAIMLKQASMSTPGYDKNEIERRFLMAFKVQDINKVYPGPEKIPPTPNPKVVVEQMKIQQKQLEASNKMKLEIAQLLQEAEVNRAKIKELEAKAALELSQAQGVGRGHAIAELEAAIGMAKIKQDGMMKALEILSKLEKEGNEKSDNSGGMGGLASPPSNQGSMGMPGGLPTPDQGSMGGGGLY